jgi:hypothetical protein
MTIRTDIRSTSAATLAAAGLVAARAVMTVHAHACRPTCRAGGPVAREERMA